MFVPAKLHTVTIGQGKPLVLLHGWAMHSGIFQDLAKQLAQNYQVICIDLPGHGLSDKIDCFTLENISAAVVNAVPHKNSVFLGWSLGATVALAIAKRYPERVNGLILLAGNPQFCTFANQDWPGMDEAVLNSFAAGLQENSTATLQRFLSLQVAGLPEARASLKILKIAVSACPAPDLDTLQAGLNILKTADLRPELARINKPVAAILGGQDKLIPVAVGRKLQQLAPELELSVIEKAGHVPFLSHTEDVLSRIEQFMEHHAVK